jgi:phosphoglycolate phosphatase
VSLAFRHLVFDLDGTLVDTKDDVGEAVNVTLEALDLPRQDPRVLWSYVGRGARTLVERALGSEHEHRIDEALAVFMPWYRRHLLDHAAVYPGMVETVCSLRADGAVFSVLTNKPADLSWAIVDGLGLRATFARLIGGDTLPVKKPDPAGLYALMDQAGVPAEATLMVGDSALDVAAGRNARVATCGVLWGFNGRAVEESGPDVLIAAPVELLAICRAGLPTTGTPRA